MSVKIKMRRGTAAQLSSYTLDTGEIGFTTDTHQVYIGEGGLKYLIGRVEFGEGNPVAPAQPNVAGTCYVNTLNNSIYFNNGTTWIKVGAQTLDEIADGANYQRVAAADVDSSGHVSQIYDGGNAVTANSIRTHLNDSTIHRAINDSGTGSTDLWSAQKISSVISAAIDGLDWQESVKDKDLNTPPASPSTGDRYIVGSSPTGDWASKAGQIARYSGSTWVFVVPNEGTCCRVEDEDVDYVYTGSGWVSKATSQDHSALTGLQGGTTSEYYHLSATDYDKLVTNLNETIQDISGGMFEANSETGISLAYNDTTGKVDASVSYGSEPPAVSSASSGTAGTATSASRSDHSHDLGTHDIVSLHSASGLTVGHVLRASGASAFGFAALLATDLPSHATRHQHGGNDEIATATSSANAIPKAGSDGKLSDGWLPILDGGAFA